VMALTFTGAATGAAVEDGGDEEGGAADED
jgi:hypothetical protein